MLLQLQYEVLDVGNRGRMGGHGRAPVAADLQSMISGRDFDETPVPLTSVAAGPQFVPRTTEQKVGLRRGRQRVPDKGVGEYRREPNPRNTSPFGPGKAKGAERLGYDQPGCRRGRVGKSHFRSGGRVSVWVSARRVIQFPSDRLDVPAKVHQQLCYPEQQRSLRRIMSAGKYDCHFGLFRCGAESGPRERFHDGMLPGSSAALASPAVSTGRYFGVAVAIQGREIPLTGVPGVRVATSLWIRGARFRATTKSHASGLVRLEGCG